jgi:hypothetical protein
MVLHFILRSPEMLVLTFVNPTEDDKIWMDNGHTHLPVALALCLDRHFCRHTNTD